MLCQSYYKWKMISHCDWQNTEKDIIVEKVQIPSDKIFSFWRLNTGLNVYTTS